MTQVRNVENDFRRIENFGISIHYLNGANVRGDKFIPNSYDFKRMANRNWTVKKLIESRFASLRHEYRIFALHANGKKAHSKTLLRNLRAEYNSNTNA